MHTIDLLRKQLIDAEEDVRSADWSGDTRTKHYAELRVIQLKNLLSAISEVDTSEPRPVAWMAGIQTAGGPEVAPEWDVVFQEGESRPFGHEQWVPLYTMPPCVSVTRNKNLDA
ncbi:hypothetical protein [Herbaspirillum sp. CF444]|uniref:hypothetical protein n=1 Tax=Herbaspirillum sp. CF444 TaxID=1144319 RepID=UPI0012FA5263|nr:hypothetical protein [Herbaspirillum sp. CF444]